MPHAAKKYDHARTNTKRDRQRTQNHRDLVRHSGFTTIRVPKTGAKKENEIKNDPSHQPERDRFKKIHHISPVYCKTVLNKKPSVEDGVNKKITALLPESR